MLTTLTASGTPVSLIK